MKQVYDRVRDRLNYRSRALLEDVASHQVMYDVGYGFQRNITPPIVLQVLLQVQDQVSGQMNSLGE